MFYATKTTNKSFINMWRYLQRNKSYNNIFMLQTIRKDLTDFSIEKYLSMDKEDPSFLTYKSRVIDEAKENIWFYFRELVMVPDENSITGYKHFELTPEFMMMVYLYEKGKSFINTNTDNELCLYFLWNLHKSLYNTDLVLVNDFDIAKEISDNIKKYIANMECQIPLGSTQVMSDGINHFLTCNKKSFNNYYTLNKFINDINKIYINQIANNDWVKNNFSIFILENDIPAITYSYLMHLIDNNDYRFYLNGLSDTTSIDSILTYTFLDVIIPKADYRIYDESELENIYLI